MHHRDYQAHADLQEQAKQNKHISHAPRTYRRHREKVKPEGVLLALFAIAVLAAFIYGGISP